MEMNRGGGTVGTDGNNDEPDQFIRQSLMSLPGGLSYSDRQLENMIVEDSLMYSNSNRVQQYECVEEESEEPDDTNCPNEYC